MRITEAAQRLGTSPRMLRYRDRLGLLPAVRGRPAAAGGHRRFTDDDIAAVALALRIERRYDISPAALAFGLRVLTEMGVRAEVAELGRRLGRAGPPPGRALEFEQERARRLLGLPPGRGPLNSGARSGTGFARPDGTAAQEQEAELSAATAPWPAGVRGHGRQPAAVQGPHLPAAGTVGRSTPRAR